MKKEIREYHSILDDERRKKKTLEKTMLNEAENAAKIVSRFTEIIEFLFSQMSPDNGK